MKCSVCFDKGLHLLVRKGLRAEYARNQERWRVTCGVCRVPRGVWRVACAAWHVTREWHVARARACVARVRAHVCVRNVSCVCVCVVCVCVVHVCVLSLLRLWNCGSIDATVEIKNETVWRSLKWQGGSRCARVGIFSIAISRPFGRTAWDLYMASCAQPFVRC